MKSTTTIYNNWTNVVNTDGRRFFFRSVWKGGLFPLESDPEQHIAWMRPSEQEQTVVVSEQVKQFRRDVLNLNEISDDSQEQTLSETLGRQK